MSITIVNGVVAVAIIIVAAGQFIMAARAVLLVAIGTGTPIIKETMIGPLVGFKLLEAAPL